jgi:hypothetical protein
MLKCGAILIILSISESLRDRRQAGGVFALREKRFLSHSCLRIFSIVARSMLTLPHVRAPMTLRKHILSFKLSHTSFSRSCRRSTSSKEKAFVAHSMT